MSDTHRPWRIGAVSYLNAKPLIAGLETDSRMRVVLDVPARLPAMLDENDVDAALVPVIDLADHRRNWRIVSDACIGCDGETLTVRVFSRVPPESIRRLHVDGDSHTSVALARIIWRERYECELDVVRYRGDETASTCEAVLLIGDKVVNHSLVDYEIETDLGSEWKSLTSLPFVFAVWAARTDSEVDVAALGRRLSQARDSGVASAEMIAADLGPGLGWPVTLAKRYLATRLKFTLGARQREGMAMFFELASSCGVILKPRELVFS